MGYWWHKRGKACRQFDSAISHNSLKIAVKDIVLYFFSIRQKRSTVRYIGESLVNKFFGVCYMNRVFLIGNLTHTPELRETASGISVTNFSIAVNRSYTSADGERQTDFFNCTVWRTLAENVAKYAKKGNKVAVFGSIQLRNYEDSDGVKRIAVDIIAEQVEFLTPKSNGGTSELPEPPGYIERQGNTNVEPKTDKPTLQTMDGDVDIPF